MNDVGNSKEKKLVKNTFILSICTLLNKGLMFVMIPFFTRWISVEEYGIYDVFATYVLLLIPIISLSSGNAIFRLSIDTTENERKEYIKSGLCLYIFNFIIAITILLICNIFFHFNYLLPFIVLLTGELLDNYFQSFLRAIKKLSLYGICKTVTVLTTAITVTILVKFLNQGIVGLIYGYSLGFFISSIIIIFITKFWKYIYKVKFSIHKVKELISYSWALIPNDISWWIINVSDRKIINIFLGDVANGIYAIAYKLPNLSSSVFGVFNISWQESATECINQQDSINFYEKVLNNTISVLLSICIGLVACNFIFFDYIFDVRYTDSRLYTPFLIASVIFGTLSLFYGGIQISLKRPKANGISTIIGAISNLAIHLLLVQYIGLYAAAISTLVSNMIVYYIRKILLKDKYNFKVDFMQYIYMILFIYFSIFAMLKVNIFINLINLFLASCIFIYINRSFLMKFLNKFLKKKNGVN